MPTDEKPTVDPTALVTGGNARIGFETCKGLLNAGFHVVVCARSEEKADKAAARLLREGPEGSTAESLVLDRREARGRGLYLQIRDADGRPHFAEARKDHVGCG